MPILAWIGNLIFTFALSNIRVLSKVMTVNFAIFAALVAASIIALTTFLQNVTTTLNEIVVTNFQSYLISYRQIFSPVLAHT